MDSDYGSENTAEDEAMKRITLLHTSWILLLVVALAAVAVGLMAAGRHGPVRVILAGDCATQHYEKACTISRRSMMRLPEGSQVSSRGDGEVGANLRGGVGCKAIGDSDINCLPQCSL